MTFEEWKEKHNDLIENVAITFFNYGCGVDTKTCYDELEYLLKKAFNAGKTKWHNLNKNYKDLPNEGEWVEGLYIWYYKDEVHWDVFKVRWNYEIGELDEKLVCWYSSDDCWHKVDEPDYWRKITLPMRNEHDRKY